MLTFENLAQLKRTAPPRKPLLVLFGALAAALCMCVLVLAAWTRETNHRRQAVAALGPATRVIVIGSSHVFSSIAPELMRVSSMNLAAPVCSYVCAEGILLGNLHRVPALEALVIELDVVAAFYDTLRAYQGDNRQLLDLDPAILDMQLSAGDKYALWRDQLLERSPLGPLFRFGKLTPREIVSRIRQERRSEDAVVAPGYANGHELMPPEDDGPARARRHVREAAGLPELQRNEAALRRMLQLAVSRRLKLALVRLPHHPGYWAALPPEWQREMRALQGRIRRDFPGIEYWDYGEPPELGNADYRNGDHLNDQAARRFTAIFDEQLTNWLAKPRAPGR